MHVTESSKLSLEFSFFRSFRKDCKDFISERIPRKQSEDWIIRMMRIRRQKRIEVDMVTKYHLTISNI